MRFVKMHGLGNDYVFVQEDVDSPEEVSRLVSDRHRGIGGDGLILVQPSKRADAKMRIFNADGSEGEMCGNGVRCVAKLLYESGEVKKERMEIETGRGVLSIEVRLDGSRVVAARVGMGTPRLERSEIPMGGGEGMAIRTDTERVRSLAAC